MIMIDAENLILGRIGTYAAKQALLGEEVIIINCEKAIVTGKKSEVIADYRTKKQRGTHKGPIYFRNPERFVKRSIRGMLPYKKEKGAKAFKKIMCYNGVPEEYKDKETIKLEQADIKKISNTKFIEVGKLCKLI